MHYYHPTRIYNYKGALAKLEEIIKENFPQASKIFVLTGKSHFKKSHFAQEVNNSLSKYEVFWEYLNAPEPNWSEVNRLIKSCEFFNPDLIIGIGGGSVLDATKPVACLSYTNMSISDVMGKKVGIASRKIGLISIPTTSGTGSEVTPFSVITNEQTNIKQSIGPLSYYPDIAIVDSRLNRTVPKKIKLDVGIDTMAHAFEALWSKKSQIISSTLAWEAIALTLQNLETHIERPNNDKASQNMATASNLAGVAFSNTFTAVCHALSFPIGFKYNISHGEACSWTLPACIEKSIDRLLQVSNATFSRNEIIDLPQRIRKIRDRYYEELNNSIPSINDEDQLFLIDNAFKPLLKNWCVEHSDTDLIDILKNI